jgi:hypothetical protein
MMAQHMLPQQMMGQQMGQMMPQMPQMAPGTVMAPVMMPNGQIGYVVQPAGMAGAAPPMYGGMPQQQQQGPFMGGPHGGYGRGGGGYGGRGGYGGGRGRGRNDRYAPY